MNETVTIAIITLISGLSGSIIGALVTYKVARAQNSESRREQLHTEKMEAYSSFVAAYHKFSEYITTMGPNLSFPEAEERGLFVELQTAYSRALLASSEETAKSLTHLYLYVSEYAKSGIQPEGMSKVYTKAITAMRSEVLTIG